jgi:hypothetical protein
MGLAVVRAWLSAVMIEVGERWVAETTLLMPEPGWAS